MVFFQRFFAGKQIVEMDQFGGAARQTARRRGLFLAIQPETGDDQSFNTIGGEMLFYDYANKDKYELYNDFITFLIQRPDVLDHNIPLSELKIFLKRTEAEKHIDLDAGDLIEFSGKIYSTALGDAWMEVDNFTVLTVKKDSTNKK